MARTYSDPSYHKRSLPDDGCGWVVTMSKSTGRYRHEISRCAGGIYRSKGYAQSLCRKSDTTCAFVVWDEEKAQAFFNFAVQHSVLDAQSMRDMTMHFGTEVSRKLMRRNNG